MYAALADIQQWLKEDKLIRLTCDDDTGIVDTSVVDAVLEAASIEIDGYLGTRYDLPFTDPPPILKKYCVDMTCHLLHVRSESSDELWESLYKNAITYLKLVGKGSVSLGAEDPEETGQAETVKISSSKRIFSRDSLKGF